MQIKKILLLLIISSSFLFAQKERLTLQDAVSFTLKNNQRIKQYEEKLKQKELDNLAAYGNFLPSLNFDLSYTHLNSNMDIDLSPIRDVIISLQSSNQAELTNIGNVLAGKGALTQTQKDAVKLQASSSLNSLIPAFTETFKKQDYKTGTFLLTQPLFVGGKLIAAKNAAYAEKESASYELVKTKNELIYESIDSYLRVILLKEVVSTRQNVLDGMNEHKIKAQKLYDEGLIAKHHLLRAEVAVSEAERNLENDENNLKLALEAFDNTTGVKSESYVFTDSLKLNVTSDSLAFFKSQAQNNQPILKIIENKKELASDNFDVARSSLLPTVAAFGKYEIYPEYLSSLEPRWAVGIQMKYNLFNGFKDYLKLQSAKHLENEVSFVQQDAMNKIDLWVTKAYLEMNNNKTRYEKLNATYELATENLRQNEKRFETGMGTSLEVIDARLSLEKVEIDRLVSLYQYYNALTDLYLASGNTSEVLNIWSN